MLIPGDSRPPIPVIVWRFRSKGPQKTDVHIPEQGRPLLKSNRLFVNLFRSIVGHSFVESHTFALEIPGKGYGRKHN